MHRQALAICRTFLRGNQHQHREVATSLNNVAVVLHLQGKLGEAETMYGQALAMRRRLEGNEHLQVANSLNNLAAVLRDQGKLADAESMQREALAIERKLLGNEHATVATSLGLLASALSG